MGPLSSAVDAGRQVVGILFMEGSRAELGLYVLIEDEEGKKDGLFVRLEDCWIGLKNYCAVLPPNPSYVYHMGLLRLQHGALRLKEIKHIDT